MKKSLLLLVALIFGITARAQQVEHAHCGTDEYVQELLNEHPEMAAQFESKMQKLFGAVNDLSPTKKSSGKIYTIPVVFHVIYASPSDSINRSQIEDAMRILNEDYRKTNPDASNLRPIFQSRQADSEIQFALAKKDPNGNCTEGITRINSPLSVNASPRDQVKALVQWDPSRYLNVWVVNSIESSSGSGITLGYANFPWMPELHQGWRCDPS